MKISIVSKTINRNITALLDYDCFAEVSSYYV